MICFESSTRSLLYSVFVMMEKRSVSSMSSLLKTSSVWSISDRVWVFFGSIFIVWASITVLKRIDAESSAVDSVLENMK